MNCKLIAKLLVGATAFAAALPLVADTETVDGIEWAYTVTNGEASLSSSCIAKSTTGDLTIPSTLGGCPVTSVGYSAFNGCGGLTSVTIPDSVTNIGNSAFSSCSGLTSFVVAPGNSKYKAVSGLLLSKDGKTLVVGINGDVTIPDSVAYIGSGAFSGRSGLTSVTIPDSVTGIGDSAFSSCSGLRSVTIPNSVRGIGWYAFGFCSGLTIVTIGNGVTSIGHRAFCSGVTSFVVAPDNSSFKAVSGLLLSRDGKTLIAGVNGDVTIPDSVTSIGDSAFYGCGRLTSVTIPNGVTNIGDNAFQICWWLKSIEFKGNAPTVGSSAFSLVDSGCTVRVPKGSLGWGVDIPGTWNGLRIEYLPEPIFTIENGELTGVELNGATSATVPDGVTSISYRAFYGCTNLTCVLIPESVTSIGAEAFCDCGSMTKIVFEGDAPGIGARCFESVNPSCVVQVCRGSIGWEVDVLGVWNGMRIEFLHEPAFVIENGELTGAELNGATSVTIPDSVTSIGGCVFYGCEELTSVTIPGSVTNIGNYVFSGCSGLTSVTIPDSVTNMGNYVFQNCIGLTSVTMSSGVTSIGAYAFSGCSNLTSVTIPDSVTNIGSYAFYNCSGLTSVTIPDSVTNIGDYAFRNCSGLTSVTIGDGVTSIGNGAFGGCSGIRDVAVSQYVCTNRMSSVFYSAYQSITNVIIPDGVTSIGSYAFSGCSGLTSVTIPDSVTNIGNNAFYNCSGLTSVTIPDSVTSIGSSAFYGCSGLTSIAIPDGVTSIGSYAFGGCSGIRDVAVSQYVCTNRMSTVFSSTYQSITNVVISDSVTNIGSSAFYGCSGLTSIAIPDGVTSIGSYAFSGCSGLKSVVIGDSVTNIGSYAFRGCSALTSVTISDSVTSVGSYAFYSCSALTSVYITDLAKWCGISFASANANPLCYANALYLNGSLVTDLSIPDGVTSVGYYAFSCTNLTSVAIPDSVTNIGFYAFYNCSGLTSVTIPDSVTSIGSYAFYNCSGLTSVTIPDSVTSIGSAAFYGCSGLTSVYITDVAKWCGISFASGNANPLCFASALYLNGSLVTDLSIPDGVTSIGYYAFSCTNLTSVAIPDSVTNIGSSAFSGCSGLTSVTIPDSVTNIGSYAFYKCSGLTSVTISDSVTDIGSYAFCNCRGLTSVAIPDSVMSIGSYAFYNCSSLTSVYVTDIAKWCGISFASANANPLCFANALYLNGSLVTDLSIPDGVTSIGSYAFSCTNLTSVTIPDSVTNIGNYAFYKCSMLNSIVFRGNAPTVGGSAFSAVASGCTVRVPKGSVGWDVNIPGTWDGMQIEYLPVFTIENGVLTGVELEGATSVTIPDGVTSIGGRVFYGCSSIASITIPDSVTNIESFAFSGCCGLTSFEVSPGNGKYKDVSGLLLSRDGKTLIAGINGEVTIPGGVTSIGELAFYGCSSLASVTIPDSVTSIGSAAFYGCSGLAHIMFNGDAPTVGGSAFSAVASGCTVCVPMGSTGWGVDIPGTWNGMRIEYLPVYTIENSVLTGVELNGATSVTIPDGVMSIGERVFYGCSELTSVAIPNSVTNIGPSAFAGCNGIRNVTVPQYVCNNQMLSVFYPVYRSIANVVISDGVTSVGKYAFASCSGLTSVTIPASVASVASSAFNNCSGLTSFVVAPGSSKYKAVSGFLLSKDGKTLIAGINGDVTIPDGVTSIGMEAFYGRSGLTSVTMPDSVTDIGSSAFGNCANLTSVAIPDNVTSIGSSAFSGCSRLNSFVVGEGNAAYKSVSGLLFTKNGKSLLAVPGAIADMTIPDDVTSIGPFAFYGCSRLTSVTIPECVTNIGDNAFAACSGLKSVTIPEGIMSISDRAFHSCCSLASVRMPGGVTNIGVYAFYNCSGLTSVTIPDSVTRIGDKAFSNCSGLTSIIFKGNAPTVGSSAFSSVASGCTVRVPRGSTGWGVDIPGTWNGMRIEYCVFQPLANAASAEDIAAALAEAADAGLAAGIADGTNYNAFCEWAERVKGSDGAAAGAQAVKESGTAWLSYALGADRLVADALTGEDVKIESFEVADRGEGAAATQFSFEVSLKDVGIGDGVAISEANRELVKANLRKVLGVEGAATLSPAAFSSDDIDVVFDVPQDGKARFTVTPPADAGNAYFMRVIVR